MNNVNLIGRTTSEATLRQTPNGVSVATVTLAVPRNRKNSNGERETDFINIVLWNNNAENFANWVKKGGRVSVTGELNTRNYENKNGQRVYVTEVRVEKWENLSPRENSESQNGFGGDTGFGQTMPYELGEEGLPF